jgi:glycosyltransferase involved in cell wall biosynthesis
MPPIRILYYVPCLGIGGTEKKVHDLALNLPRDQFDPIVMWSCFWGTLGESLTRAGIPVQRVPFNRPSGFGETVKRIQEVQPDIFHSFSYLHHDRDVRAAIEAGVPTILTYRGDLRFWDAAQTAQGWETFRNERSKRVTVCSHAIADVVRTVEKVPDAKILVIHNGVRVPDSGSAGNIREEMRIEPGDFLIGYVGNYRPEKGHQTLLRAFREVLDSRPSVRLVCCGAGDFALKQELMRVAAALGLGDRALLLDMQSDMDRVYRGLDLYVHPSDTEGFSNALLEAMSHGLPIVATRTGGNCEAIQDRQNGLLVPAGHPEGLALAIESLLADSGLRTKFGKAARDRVEQWFTFEGMLQRYSSLYFEEVAANGRYEEKRTQAAPMLQERAR